MILAARDTPISDLTPLTRLENLNDLDIGGTRVRDLEPLTRIKFLLRLDIGTTQIQSLEPLTRIKYLSWVNLHRSYALDGSKQHFDTLPPVRARGYNGSAFKQNYVPGLLYLLTVMVIGWRLICTLKNLSLAPDENRQHPSVSGLRSARVHSKRRRMFTPHAPNPALAAGLTLLAAAFAAGTTLLAKALGTGVLGPEMPALQISFGRFLFALMSISIFILIIRPQSPKCI